ncbi:biotin transporter BioY [bacterium]|nr:biotin transporter BioY [bacterium]
MTTKTVTITRTALFAAFMAVSAFIRIPTGIVPLTLQSSAALITGYCLGPVQGAAACTLYMIVGLAGLPVFASGGGPAYILSPTFGYILGFTVCASLTGFLARFNRRGSVIFALFIMIAGLAGIYVPGVLWLIVAMHWIADVPASVYTLLKVGLFIPLIGDLITTIPAAFIAVRIRKRLTAGQ